MTVPIISIEKAIELLKNEKIVALPTETVYGLAGRSDSTLANDLIYLAKNRPKSRPLINHFKNAELAFASGVDVQDYAYELAEKFWPGPLTLVIDTKNTTSAVRVPNNPIFQAILDHFPNGLFAPSANLYSKVTPTKPQHVIDDYAESNVVSGVVDGGEKSCEIGIESTIVSCVEPEPIVLRYGATSQSQIQEAIGIRPKYHLDVEYKKIITSGMDSKHYSPDIEVVAIETLDEVLTFKNMGVIGIDIKHHISSQVKFIASYKNIEDMAANLYSDFRFCEKEMVKKLYVLLPRQNEDNGLIMAVRDRVSRASSN
jgi:L-threonylcarbamoyladenylate synthase